MRRRIAADAERCEKELGRQAIWKARRLGRSVEGRCSRKRVPDSPFCIYHQPGKKNGPEPRIAPSALLGFLSARAGLFRAYGPPPGNRPWWPRRMCSVQGIPYQSQVAEACGLNDATASRVLAGKAGILHAAGQPQRVKQNSRWTDADLIAWAQTIAKAQGQFPCHGAYRAPPGGPAVNAYERWCKALGGSWEMVGRAALVPMAAPLRRFFTAEEAEYIRTWYARIPTSQIAERLGRSRSSVLHYLYEHERELITDWEGMLTLKRAAAEYGVPCSTLHKSVLRGDIPATVGQRGRSRFAGHKDQRFIFLDPEDVEAWLERRTGGVLLAGGSE